jgi:hypothetical protein
MLANAGSKLLLLAAVFQKRIMFGAVAWQRQ